MWAGREQKRIDACDIVVVGAGLVGAAGSLRAGHPQARVDHPLAQGLGRHRNAVVLKELLAGERRAEVGVAGSDEAQGVIADRRRQLAVAGMPALARDEPGRPLLAQGSAQAPDLALAQPELLRRLPLRQPSLGLQGRHGAWNRTFLSWRKPDISIWVLQINVR